MPDDLASVTAPNATTIVFKMTGTVNPYWFTYNELSQITPLPMAWDISATGQKSGSEACGTAKYRGHGEDDDHEDGQDVTPASAAAKSCAAVYTYLSKQSGFNPANPKAPNNSLKTYATNPLWQVVDGPWHLSAFNASGNVTSTRTRSTRARSSRRSRSSSSCRSRRHGASSTRSSAAS